MRGRGAGGTFGCERLARVFHAGLAHLRLQTRRRLARRRRPWDIIGNQVLYGGLGVQFALISHINKYIVNVANIREWCCWAFGASVKPFC